MWIRTDYRLIPVENTHIFRPAGSSFVYIGSYDIGFGTPEKAQATLDEIHNWLGIWGYPAVLDLREKENDG